MLLTTLSSNQKLVIVALYNSGEKTPIYTPKYPSYQQSISPSFFSEISSYNFLPKSSILMFTTVLMFTAVKNLMKIHLLGILDMVSLSF